MLQRTNSTKARTAWPPTPIRTPLKIQSHTHHLRHVRVVSYYAKYTRDWGWAPGSYESYPSQSPSRNEELREQPQRTETFFLPAFPLLAATTRGYCSQNLLLVPLRYAGGVSGSEDADLESSGVVPWVCGEVYRWCRVRRTTRTTTRFARLQLNTHTATYFRVGLVRVVSGRSRPIVSILLVRSFKINETTAVMYWYDVRTAGPR